MWNICLMKICLRRKWVVAAVVMEDAMAVAKLVATEKTMLRMIGNIHSRKNIYRGGN